MGEANRGRARGVSAIACGVVLAGALGAPVAAQVLPPEPTCTPIANTKLRLRKVDDGIGDERILFRGEMEVDETIALDLTETGLQFQMIDANGVSILDVTLPGMEFGFDRVGWVSNSGNSVWNWRDGDLQVSGFKRVVVKRPPRSNRLKVVLFGQDFEFALPTLPLRIRVLIPTADGTAVICGQQIAQEVECFFRNQGNKLICR